MNVHPIFIFRVEELRWVKLLSKQWFGKFRKNLV